MSMRIICVLLSVVQVVGFFSPGPAPGLEYTALSLEGGEAPLPYIPSAGTSTKEYPLVFFMQATATGAPKKVALIGATNSSSCRCERHRTDGMVCAPSRDIYLMFESDE